ncbi:helix-turn-helix transcriptional regulator [Erwinia amylovora]|uniref:helix-turn-helix transcriptional regulator n=1 Tax=Erwinia amylovora TaxID=552 RepID=UPI001443B8C4|nr:PAS domain-containing protein [Erwinia amylovora]
MHQESYQDDFTIMIATIENLSEPWGIKDTQSRHIYMNRAARSYTCTPDNYDLEGKLDNEFPTTWAEQADGFIEHDKLAERSTTAVSVIETDHWYGSKEIEPYLSEKIPLRNINGTCIGTLWNARRIKVMSPLVCIGEKVPAVVQTSTDQSIFTKSEMDIVYLLLKRLSRKEIANILNLSPKTIANKIHNMYSKSETHSLIQFEEYCRHIDLHNYLPSYLINKGIRFI